VKKKVVERDTSGYQKAGRGSLEGISQLISDFREAKKLLFGFPSKRHN
jgi:hypothetical protein